MKFIDFVKTASDDELIKTAEAFRLGLQNNLRAAIIPVMEKIAEQIHETASVKEEKAPTEEEAAMAAEMAPSAGIPQGESNIATAVPEGSLDKNAMKEAIKETIYTNNLNGLKQIVEGVAQAHGEEMAEAAISIARQIMQEGLVAGDLQKEQIAALAEAFKAVDAEVAVAAPVEGAK